MSESPLTVRSYGNSYIGRRANNEDSLGKREPADALIRATKGCLYVVSDGMGGHAAGEVASRMAVEAILANYYIGQLDRANDLQEAIRTANDAIYAVSGDKLDTEGMGCTVVACVLCGSNAIISHVGDSRAYRLRGHILERLTEDHTVRAEANPAELEAGLPPVNVLSRAVGVATSVDIATSEFAVHAGDRILLCTDGLTNAVPDDELRDALLLGTPREVISSLLGRAASHAARDNASAIALIVDRSEAS